MDLPPVAADRELRCARHPSTVTYLRCGNCGTPICPRCQVMTPVGSKCPDCARVRLNRAFQFGPLDAIIAVVICLAGGVALGLIASVTAVILPRTLLEIFIPSLAGVALASTVRRAIPRKRAIILPVLLGVGVLLAWISFALGDFAVRDPASFLDSRILWLLVRNLSMGMVLKPVDVLFVGFGIWIAIQWLNR